MKISSLFCFKRPIIRPLHASMQKPIAILAAALVLPAIAGIAWVLTPAPQPLSEDTPRERIRDSAAPVAVSKPAGIAGSARPPATARVASPISRPGIARPAEEFFPESIPASAQPTVTHFPAPPAPSVSPRYTLTTQANAATLAAGLQNQPPLRRDERIRVLPTEGISPATGPAVANGAVAIVVDASLHDPAAWLEDAKPGSAAKADQKAKIGDAFAAEVAAAAKQTERGGKSLDATWQDARAKANWQYQKIFGGEAANRAAINAGRAAVSGQQSAP
jgi:hypothetical protein